MTREPDGRNARNVQTSPRLTRPILPYREATVKVFLGTPDGRSVTLDVAVLQNVNLGKRWDRFPRGLSAAWATAIGSVGVALAVSAGITSAIFLLTRQFGTREHRITDAGRDCARLRSRPSPRGNTEPVARAQAVLPRTGDDQPRFTGRSGPVLSKSKLDFSRWPPHRHGRIMGFRTRNR